MTTNYKFVAFLLTLVSFACSKDNFRPSAAGSSTKANEENQHVEQTTVGKPAESKQVDAGTTEISSQAKTVNIEDLCAAQVGLQQVVRKIAFPRPSQSCTWGAPDNLPPQSSTAAGHQEQTMPLDLPEKAVICGLSFSFATQSLRYDDHFLLNFGDVVLASTYSGLTSNLKISNGMKLYEWSKVRGSKWPDSQSEQHAPYCIGGAAGTPSCDIPKTENTGKIQLQIPGNIAIELSKRVESTKKYNFSVIGIGDNDNGDDCMHSGISFDVTVSYAPKS